MTSQYNHMYDIAFSVITDKKDPDKVPWKEIREAIHARVRLMDQNPSEREGVGFCDTYSEGDEAEPESSTVVILNDGQTWSTISGCRILTLPTDLSGDDLDDWIRDNAEAGEPVKPDH